ncbi:MAG: 2-hydroxychromene-2-carboxylate isomerase [Pseudomonadota bacterium]
MKTVEFFFDIVSPASYLAWTQLPKIAGETGAEIVYRPFFLPGVFEKAGSSSPITSPNKGKWAFEDFNRYARKYGVPLVMNSRFPLSSVYAMRGLNNYRDSDAVKALGDGFYQAMWVENKDINDPAIVQSICESAGVNPAEYQERLNDPGNKQSLMDVTDEAVSRGVFGAPTFFIGEIMHWGQDRLEFVREELAG